MPSASRKKRVAAAWCLLAAGGLGAVAGCTTTQQTASRLQVKNSRILAARRPVVVTRSDHDMKVVHTTLVRGKGAAVAVVLRNEGKRPANDLPLAVGVRTAGGGVKRLNRKVSAYFQGHAPALAPGQETTWVYTTPQPVEAGAAVARVGAPAGPPIAVAHQLPKLEASGPAHPSSDRIEVKVSNTSAVTQYDVGVYAAAKKGGRVVAAGQASVVKIDPGTTATVPLKLIGDARGAAISVYAPATIFE